MSTNLVNDLGGVAGFGEAFLARNDDSSTALIDIRSIFPNGLNFFGRMWTGIYINNNGNITFANSISSFTPTQITGNTSNPIIAAFWADVDTRGNAVTTTPGGTSTGTNLMWYDLDPVTGTITVTWDDVGYYSGGVDKLNAFQLQLVRVNDTDFNIVFRYEDINWTTGDASDGTDGLGGTPARAGYSSGDGLNFFELPQSGNQAAILALESSSNIAQPGTWIFQVRSGAPVIELSIADIVQAEGNGPGTTTMTFEVILSSPSSQVVQVEYFTQTDTAGSGDFIPMGGTLTFAPGQTHQTVTVEILGDTLSEADEVFNVRLANAVNADIADDSAVGTIVNDDGLVISDVQVTEGSGSGTTNATFTVTLLSASTGNVTVNFATVAGTALGGTDYTPASGTLIFAPGEITKTVTVAVNRDLLVETNEDFSVQLSDATGATIVDATGIATIVNDDGFVINDVTLFEGSGTGTTAFTFNVNLLSVLTSNATVDYQVVNVSASSGSDYVVTTGTLSFTAGQTQKQVTVNVNKDSLVEADETFMVLLSNPTVTGIADGIGVGTIRNDDGIYVADALMTEGDSGTSALTFTVTMNSASSSAVTVEYTTVDGTATVGTDYAATSGTLTFAAGETSKTVTVNVIGDTTPEASETMTLQLFNAVGSGIVDGSATGTIGNNDGLRVNNPLNLSEGGSGTKIATFTVSLNAASSQQVTVNYATGDGTATAGSDYVATFGTLVFAPGDLIRTVDVTINGDTDFEPNETFQLILSDPVGSLIVNNSGTQIITNDDAQPPPVMYISNVSQTEGSGSGTSSFQFLVTLSRAASGTVTVDYATQGGTAASLLDFTPVSGTLTFAAGETSKIVTVPVLRDAAVENNEGFTLQLSNLSGSATLGQSTGTGTILNDDVSMSIDNVSVQEGNSGITTATFNVTLSGASPLPVSVDFSTLDGTATEPGDYAGTSGTLVFAPGETVKQVTVNVEGEELVEGDETITLQLSNPVYATLAQAQGTATILNDDSAVTIQATDAIKEEGDTGPTAFVFEVTREGNITGSASVDWVVSGSGSNPAQGSDFSGAQFPSGTVHFTPGETTRTITVNVNGDFTREQNEGFVVTLTNPLGTSLGAGIVATSISDAASGGSEIRETYYSIDGSGSGDFTLSYEMFSIPDQAEIFVNGTLVASTSGLVSGVGVLTVPGSSLNAGDLVLVRLTGNPDSGTAWNYTIDYEGGVQTLDYLASGQIVNDDLGAIWITATDAIKAEGNSGPTEFTFTVTRESGIGAASVDWEVEPEGNSPVDAADFVGGVLPSGTLNFAPGELSLQIVINVNGDLALESHEIFEVTLSNAVNATIGDSPTEPGEILPGVATVFTPFGGIDAAVAMAMMAQIMGEDSGLTVTSAQYTGSAGAASSFNSLNLGSNSSTALVLGQGVLLTSGDGTPPTTNTASNYTQNNSVPGDAGLDVYADEAFSGAGSTVDATILQATFTVSAQGDPAHISIDLIFGSDEYPEYSDSSYVDIAAIEIDGVNYAYFNQNPQQPLSVIGDNLEVGNFIDNGGGQLLIEYDGVSAPLRVVGALNPDLAVHTIRIAIADTGDFAFDSGIFLSNLRVFDGDAGSGGISIISQDSAQGRILNDDVTVAVSDVSVIEGNSGVSAATFAITLSGISGLPVTVNYHTVDGSAAAESDFVSASGTLTFAPGETVKMVTVDVLGDQAIESNETFMLQLSNLVNTTVADDVGLATIISDDLLLISGTPDNDVLVSSAVSELIDGNAGIDVAVFGTTLAEAVLGLGQNGFAVSTDLDGDDTLVDVERLQFTDTHVAIDLHGNAGLVAKLIAVLFGVSALQDPVLVGEYLSQLDGGMTLEEIAALGVASQRFEDLAGSHSHADFITQVFLNVVGVPPAPADLATFVGLLDDGSATQAALAALVANLPAMDIIIDLNSLAETGIPYTLVVPGSVIYGTDGPDSLVGTPGNDQLFGLGDKDTLTGEEGNDLLDGGAGIDLAVFDGARSNFSLSVGIEDWGIVDNVGAAGSDTLVDVERLQFSDTHVALDLDGNAGIAVKILGVTFGAASVANPDFVGIALTILDGGSSYEDLMQAAINVALGGPSSNAAVANLLYTNLIGFAPSPTDLDTLSSLIDDGYFTQASLGVAAAELSINLDNINLVGLATTGVDYVLYA